MSVRAMTLSGLAAAGLLLAVPMAAQAATPASLTGTQLASRRHGPLAAPLRHRVSLPHLRTCRPLG